MVQTLRPLTVGELLDRTFFYYRRHFVMFVGIAALPGLLGLAFQLGIIFKPTESSAFLTAVFYLVSLIVLLVTSTLAQGATVVAVSQILLDRETNVAEAFASIRIRELLIISVAVGVMVVIGLILFIVPGVWLGLRFSLAIPAAVLEETSASDSLSRSATLTQGDKGRIFLILLLMFMITFIASMLWPFMAGLVMGFSRVIQTSPTVVWPRVVLQFGSFVTQSLVGSLMPIALTLVYYDERVRKEAFDLEHMMRQLDGSALLAPPRA